MIQFKQEFVKHKVWLGPEAFDMAKFFIANSTIKQVKKNIMQQDSIKL
jgi:hypothetical protein